MRLKALALVLLVFFAAFTAGSAIAVVGSRQTARSLGSVETPFFVCAWNDTIVTPNGPIDTPGGPT